MPVVRAQAADITIEGVKKMAVNASVLTLQNDNLEAENTFASPAVVSPMESTVNTKGKNIPVALKPYSLSVIRVKLK